MAVDPDGNAVVVWDRLEGGQEDIVANRLVAGTGWGTAGAVETHDGGEALAPRVAVDAAGNATAVWGQYDGIRWSAWTNRFVPGTGWGARNRSRPRTPATWIATQSRSR